jgi:exopolyphosphatase/guanosine-5'-triphosphate,3'-diphosphate pyrophosphatase
MADNALAPSGARRFAPPPQRSGPLYAALDLGTNNCRLLIATPEGRGFRVVDSFSRIVRLGEGLGQTGRLSDAAQARTLDALRACAERLARRPIVKSRLIATQACRAAENGPGFLDQVQRELGLAFEVISTETEARLAAAGCLNLIGEGATAALILDVGGGSTELSWVNAAKVPTRFPFTDEHLQAAIETWYSIPLGVVSLAERHPEPHTGDRAAWFAAMIADVKAALADATPGPGFVAALATGTAHLIGTSGAVTSLAGVHLELERYTRSRVDGLWMDVADVDGVTQRLLAKSQADRALEPCIGAERADLVMAGAAILAAVLELWPPARVRVADRGLREGVLIGLLGDKPKKSRRRRKRK